MKKIFFVMIAALLFIVPLAQISAAKTIELSMSLFISERHNRYKFIIKPWIDMIAEKTDNQVKIVPYFANALCPPTEVHEATFNGIADLAEGVTWVNAGRYPLSETIMLPELGFTTALQCSRALWHIYKKFPEVQAEYKGVKVLWLHSSPPMRILTTKRPVRNLKDLKGLKIWALGNTSVKAAEVIGFTPVTLPMADVYLSLQKGVLDGSLADDEITISRKFYEPGKYFTDLALLQVNFFIIMNQSVWDNLPQDVQKVMASLTGDWAVDFTGSIRDQKDLAAREEIKAKGVEYITLSEDQKQLARKLLAPVQNQYAEALDKKGLPGTEVLQELKRMAKQ